MGKIKKSIKIHNEVIARWKNNCYNDKERKRKASDAKRSAFMEEKYGSESES